MTTFTIKMSGRKPRVLVCCTGSVATIKVVQLVKELVERGVEVRLVPTKASVHFVDLKGCPVEVFTDKDEWNMWEKRGDPVLHIDLGKWADVLLIAPLSANTLAKVSQGLCDNLLTCIVRAWDVNKPLLFCPAMNTRMWEHPITSRQVQALKDFGYLEIPCIAKTLMCGDTGLGAMAEVDTIVLRVMETLSELKSS